MSPVGPDSGFSVTETDLNLTLALAPPLATGREKLGGVQGILQRVQSEANVSIVCLGKAMALLLRLKSLSNRDLPEVFYV